MNFARFDSRLIVEASDARHAKMSAMTTLPAAVDKSSPRYAGWRVVFACYLAAVFCWGFGLYGHGVYLAELNRLHGWPTSLISAGTTAFYLLTAALVVFISDAIARLGPARDAGRRLLLRRRGGADRLHHRALAALSAPI